MAKLTDMLLLGSASALNFGLGRYLSQNGIHVDHELGQAAVNTTPYWALPLIVGAHTFVDAYEELRAKGDGRAASAVLAGIYSLGHATFTAGWGYIGGNVYMWEYS